MTGIGGAAKQLSFGTTVALGAIDGWLSGLLSRGVMNLVAGNSFFDGYNLQAFLTDTITGGVMSGIFYSVGKVFTKAVDTIVPLVCGANSFSAETTVVTEEGDTPIHEIQIGDYVLAWNEDTGELGWYKVTDTIHHTDEVVVHLIIDGEEIETTPEHPFYVEGKGWVDAEGLQLGDDIRSAEGETGEVESIEIEETTQEMYNLTVETAHTFFVGDGQWLVHNVSCNGEIAAAILNSNHQSQLDNHIFSPVAGPKLNCYFCAVRAGLNEAIYGRPRAILELFIGDYNHAILGVLNPETGFVMIVDNTPTSSHIYGTDIPIDDYIANVLNHSENIGLEISSPHIWSDLQGFLRNYAK